MKKLITLGEKVDLLEIAYNLNGGAFVMQEVNELIEYKRFLDQPLAKEMFVGDKAIFDGFKDVMGQAVNKSKSISIYFGGNITGIEHKQVANWNKLSIKGNRTLHDLAELTKANQLELK